MSAVNCPNPLTRRREYLRSPIARKVGGPLKAMSFLMSTQAAGFSPDDISSLAHWYDATEITGNDGDAIGTWADQEGTDDLTQSTSSKKPTLRTGSNGIDSKQILEGDGSDDFMDVDFTDISEPWHLFMVGKLRTVNNGDRLFDGKSVDESNFAVSGSGDWQLFQGGAAKTGSAADTSSHIFTTLWKSGSNNDTLRLDGTQDISGDSGNATLTGLTVFSRPGGNFSPLDCGEVILYDTELSTSDRDDVESYLSDKWGITI